MLLADQIDKTSLMAPDDAAEMIAAFAGLSDAERDELAAFMRSYDPRNAAGDTEVDE